MNDEWVAVLGGARRYTRDQLQAAYLCGAQLARRGRSVITGATGGIPHAAALGAKDAGGLVVGISPALNARDHVQSFGKPLGCADLVVYSGLGVDGRAPLILRSAGAAIFIGGEMGTLAEFAAGWICGCSYLGLLESAGGITAELRRITSSVTTTWGSEIVIEADATALADAVCDRMDTAAGVSARAVGAECVADVLDAVAELRPC